jgi:prolyl 4-hydroxylase
MSHCTPSISYWEHHDYIDLQGERDDEVQEGHRILTAFLYLNEVEEGGGTTFTSLNMTVTPKTGRLLIWPSVLDDAPKEIDWRTEHEAEAVKKGRKYGANIWFHNRPYQTAWHTYVCIDENGNEHIATPPEEDEDE